MSALPNPTDRFELTGSGRAAIDAPDAVAAEQLDPQATLDLLRLVVARPISLKAVRAWSPEELRAVQAWAEAVYQVAADNECADVPPVPAALRALGVTDA